LPGAVSVGRRTPKKMVIKKCFSKVFPIAVKGKPCMKKGYRVKVAGATKITSKMGVKRGGRGGKIRKPETAKTSLQGKITARNDLKKPGNQNHGGKSWRREVGMSS